MSTETPMSEEEAKRRQAGKEKKLFHIEVLHYLGNETKRHTLSNQYGEEVMNFRKNVFAAGLMIPVDPNRWAVIPPCDIKEITIEKQSKFFEP